VGLVQAEGPDGQGDVRGQNIVVNAGWAGGWGAFTNPRTRVRGQESLEGPMLHPASLAGRFARRE